MLSDHLAIKPFKTKREPSIDKHRLSGSDPITINQSTAVSVNIAFHFWGVGFFTLFGSALKNGCQTLLNNLINQSDKIDIYLFTDVPEVPSKKE